MYLYDRQSSTPGVGSPSMFGWPAGASTLAEALAECVPAAPVLVNPAQINTAVDRNCTLARTLGWGNLYDQIEVNILGCPRANNRLTPIDFAQAVALFQQTNGLGVDGTLGANTWNRMKAVQAERDPFPRMPISLDFNPTLSPAPRVDCENGRHPAIDILAPQFTPVPVVADGTVIHAGPVGSIRDCVFNQVCRTAGAPNDCSLLAYGQAVIVEHPGRGPAGQSAYTLYAHLVFRGSHKVSAVQRVLAGRLIGEVGCGCVGFSTGPHLHYAVATGPAGFRFRGGGPSRCQICRQVFCALATVQCPRCNFPHFWDVVAPQRPRTTVAAGFRW